MLRALFSLIDDVTTTPEAPPEFRALERERPNLGRDMKYPPAYAELQRRSGARLRPLLTDLGADQVFELVQAAALRMPRWEIASVEAGLRQLEAVAQTRWPLIKEDLVIQVRPEARGSSVHVRCKSRRGKGVLGAPGRRIQGFLRKLRVVLS